MDTIVEYGVDISSDWDFTDGDINTVSDKNNITQAITNRLNTITDSLDLFYIDYGSSLQSFLGWRKVDETLSFIKLEIDSCLSKDPRLKTFESSVSFDDQGSVRVELKIFYEGDVLDLNFVLDTNGVEVIS